MSVARAVPALALFGLAGLVALGIWLLASTPSTLVNEAPRRLGPTPGPAAETVVVQVEEGESAAKIGERLEEAGVIESARLFRVLAALMGLEDDLAAGDYELARGQATVTVLHRISQGLTSPLTVTVREGLRLEEVGELLDRRGVITADEFRRALADRYQAAFLTELPSAAGLEGFLFPATYGFSRGVGGHEVVQTMLDAFQQRYDEVFRQRLAASGLSLYEVVTLASIVEREARLAEERPLIASVFLNRLEQGLPLQADPSVQYALAADPASVRRFGYWKEELTAADLAVDSPYNTYVNVGLPPGPIASPGQDAILAVLEPAETDFLFFVARPDGSHAFATTLQEHRDNVCAIDPERPEC